MFELTDTQKQTGKLTWCNEATLKIITEDDYERTK